MDRQEKMLSNKLVVTRYQNHILSALISGNHVQELSLEDEETILGNIYVGKVKNIVKNLNSAFVSFREDQTGYYSLTDNSKTLYASAASGKLKAGDEIIVQVAKDAVKTKDPVLSSNLNFTGKYAVLTAANTSIGFSSKITDRTWKEAVRPKLEELTQGQVGVIVRTNAYDCEELLYQEIDYLRDQYARILKNAPFRTCYSLLYKAESGYLKIIKNLPKQSLAEIITDDPAVYDEISSWLSIYQKEDAGQLRLYTDEKLPLYKLYALETTMKQACQKKVWLKSGGYLVIEQTEAMVVIDVNTGKYSGKKDLDATIRKINLEAAEEICYQLRLRNLSGIIMIDFIDMKEEQDRELLLTELRRSAAMDTVKTTVIDMTPLGLVEMTRKKGRRPFYEQMAALKKMEF